MERFLCAFKILVQQVVKCVRGAVPVQDFPGPIIEHHLHALDAAAGQLIKARPFGEELAQQAIGVLVRAPRPGVLDIISCSLNSTKTEGSFMTAIASCYSLNKEGPDDAS